jgi:hypothetical protein
MVIMLYTDGDSGIHDLKGNWMNETIWGSTYLIITPNEQKKLFIDSWNERKLGISDRVFEAFKPLMKDIEYCLMNDIEEKFENGNYELKLINKVEFYYIEL